MSVLGWPTILGLVSTLAYILYTKWRRKDVPLPPGPKGWPIIGNALDIPTESMGPVYAGWAKRFGKYRIDGQLAIHPYILASGSEIVSASMFGKTMVIIDSYDAAIELLEKRAAKYSSRWVVCHLSPAMRRPS